MGPTVLEVEVANPAKPEIAEKVEFLIDSGANYSVVPSAVLERLGIRPVAQQEFRLTDGSQIIRKKGAAVYNYHKRAGGADVVFGEEGDCNLLGAFTLAALGLFLDPIRRELKPLPMILAETGASCRRPWEA
jgi:clan AA aspartic protease